jgi:hypothetical protein
MTISSREHYLLAHRSLIKELFYFRRGAAILTVSLIGSVNGAEITYRFSIRWEG